MESYATTEVKLKKPSGQIKWKDLPKAEPKAASPEDDLNDLLQVKYWVLRQWLL